MTFKQITNFNHLKNVIKSQNLTNFTKYQGFNFSFILYFEHIERELINHNIRSLSLILDVLVKPGTKYI